MLFIGTQNHHLQGRITFKYFMQDPFRGEKWMLNNIQAQRWTIQWLAQYAEERLLEGASICPELKERGEICQGGPGWLLENPSLPSPIYVFVEPNNSQKTEYIKNVIKNVFRMESATEKFCLHQFLPWWTCHILIGRKDNTWEFWLWNSPSFPFILICCWVLIKENLFIF